MRALVLASLLLSAACASPAESAAPPPLLASATEIASASPPAAAPAPEPIFRSDEAVSVWIQGGDVIDGGPKAKRRRADVIVQGERITFVGRVDDGTKAERTVDARGLVVAPGFVDVHAHSDPLGNADHLLAQGVTTMVVGQDGYSPGEDLGAWLDQVAASRPRVNVAALVGHHTLRSSAGLGASPRVTDKHLARMTELVDRAMVAGAFGLSTGLEYEPGSAATADELARIARPVGERGGVVMSHLRSEDDDKIEASLAELFAQCQAAGARAHVAHLKIVLGKGKPRAQAILAAMQEARAGGLSVTADLYPYTASHTTLGILFPAFAKPPNEYARARTTRKEELRSHLRARVTQRNGPEAMILGSGSHQGKTLAEASRREGLPFEDLLLALGPSGGTATYFVMDEAVMETLFQDPWVMVGTDGGGGAPHPRGHGSFARVLKRLVRERGLVSLEAAVHKMAALPASTLSLRDRGRVAPGHAADLLVFDPAEVEDTASYAIPHAVAKGMRHVLVNGVLAVEDGRRTAGRSGKALRRDATAGSGSGGR